MTFLLVALLACGALADDPGFQEGTKLYDALDYEQALVKFQDAQKRATTDADRAAAAMWIGLAAAGTGDLDEAGRELEAALRLDPTLQLPKNTSPTLVAKLEDIRAALAREAPAPLAPETTAPTAPPPAGDDGPSPLVIAGGVTAGVGALALVGGAVLTAVMLADLAQQDDPDTFADDARAANAAAGQSATGAALLLPVGAVLAGGGAALLVLGLE